VTDEGAAPAIAKRASCFPWLVAGLWAWRTALATLVAGPAAALAGTTFPAPPAGDGLLWEPGAHALLFFALREAHGVLALARSAAIVLAFGAIVGLLPLCMVLVVIAQRDGHGTGRGPRLARATAIAIHRLPALALLAVAMGAAEAAIVGAGVLTSQLATALASNVVAQATAELVGGALGLAFVPVLLAIGVAHDLARAAVVRFRAGAMRAFFLGMRAWRAAPWTIAWAWSWRSALALAPVLLAAVLAMHIGGGGGIASVVGLAIAHQATTALRVTLRVSWLAKALRSISP
jgi:hypothetical protein